MENQSFCVLYKNIKIKKNEYMLVPLRVLRGKATDDEFIASDKSVYHTSDRASALENDSEVVGMVYQRDYFIGDDGNYSKKAQDDVLSCDKDTLFFVTVDRNGIVTKKSVYINDLRNKSYLELYQALQVGAGVTLNESLVDSLLQKDDGDLRKTLASYKGKILELQKKNEEKGVSEVDIEDGKIVRIETKGEVYVSKDDPFYKLDEYEQPIRDEEDTFVLRSDITAEGLYNYLKERVIGHDRELKYFASQIVRNLRLKSGQKARNILIPGPTGTGKTLTLETAAEYLRIPYLNVDTGNLNPAGYEGTSIEDQLLSLIDRCDGDMNVARRALVAFDEFDKLNDNDLDLKKAMKSLLLKITEGAIIPLQERSYGDTIRHTFDTSLLNKVYLGAFERAFEEKKPTIGFGTAVSKMPATFSKQTLFDCGYYNNELISRIPIILPFYALNEEQMRQAIMCKGSELYKQIEDIESYYGVKVDGIEDFVEGIMAILTQKDKSMRDLNNLIINAFLDIEYTLQNGNGKYRVLTLSNKTASDSTNFDLR